MPNPFGTTFESLESPAGPVVDAVHEAPYRRLLALIDSGDGQLVSLRAPRAGYGKTMLLSRLRDKKKASMAIIPIHLADGRRVEGESILEEVLTQLAESVPGAGGLTKLDLHTRRLFAHGLLPLVYSGEVPSQDKAGALDSLRDRPTEAFDFHNEGASIAQWTKSQFEVLSPRLASVLGKSCGASTRDTSYWIHLLSQFAVRTPSEASRTGDLMDAVFGFESRFRTGAGFLDGLGSLLNLITLVEPAVLVLDEVDGLSSDSDSALRATSSLISLWESAPRTSVIISVNDDVWESAFAPRLPLGLRDRLEDVVIRLNPLTKEEAEALVRIRAGSHSDKVLKEIDLGSGNLYPRGVLKAAREAWEKCDVDDQAETSKEEDQPKDRVTATSEFSISGASASDQSGQSSEPEKLAKSEPVTGVASQPESTSSSKILAGAAAVSSFVKAKGRKTTPEAADLEEAKTSVAQVDVVTPDRPSPFGESTDEKLTDSKPAQESSPFEAAPPEAASSVKEVVTKDPIYSPQEGFAAKEAATIQPVTPEKVASPFEAALPEAASSVKEVVTKDPIYSPQEGFAAKEAATIQPVTPEKVASPFEAAPAEAASPLEEVVTKDPISLPQEGVAAKEATTIQPVTPEKEMSPFEAALSRFATPQPGVAVKEVADIQPVTPQKVASPFEAASPQIVSPFESAPVQQAAAPIQTPVFAQETSPAQAVAAPVESSPFQVAPAQQVAAAPVQAPSPFEAAPAQAASPFQAQPAAVAASPASPFQVSNQARPQGQSTLPPARPIAQHIPAQPSPFEAAQAPVTAMDMAPAAASPYEAAPIVEERRSQRVFPSNSPFDSAVAKAVSAPAQGFPAQPAPVQAESIQAPPIFAAAPTPAVTPVQQSPFDQNLAPKAFPAQPNVPKGDTDAIDELLRQFREHRDS